MSGIIRRMKRAFKKLVKAVKKYWWVVVAAAAIYFTAGMATGAMGSGATATGAVSAGSTAAATGTGVASSVGAVTTGAASAGSAAAAAGALETVTVTAAAGGGISAGTAGAVAAGAAAGAAASSGGSAASGARAPTPQAQTPKQQSMLGKMASGFSNMSFADKMLIASTGVQVVSSLAAPSPEEEAAANAKWQGAYYGNDAKGAEAALRAAPATKTTAPATGAGKTGDRPLFAQDKSAEAQSTAGPPEAPMTGFDSTLPGQDQQSAPASPAQQRVTNMGGNRDLFATRAPGVRYV